MVGGTASPAGKPAAGDLVHLTPISPPVMRPAGVLRRLAAGGIHTRARFAARGPTRGSRLAPVLSYAVRFGRCRPAGCDAAAAFDPISGDGFASRCARALDAAETIMQHREAVEMRSRPTGGVGASLPSLTRRRAYKQVVRFGDAPFWSRARRRTAPRSHGVERTERDGLNLRWSVSSRAGRSSARVRSGSRSGPNKFEPPALSGETGALRPTELKVLLRKMAGREDRTASPRLSARQASDPRSDRVRTQLFRVSSFLDSVALGVPVEVRCPGFASHRAIDDTGRQR